MAKAGIISPCVHAEACGNRSPARTARKKTKLRLVNRRVIHSPFFHDFEAVTAIHTIKSVIEKQFSM